MSNQAIPLWVVPERDLPEWWTVNSLKVDWVSKSGEEGVELTLVILNFIFSLASELSMQLPFFSIRIVAQFYNRIGNQNGLGTKKIDSVSLSPF